MKLDFEKMGGLIPAIVQDYNTNKVLMLGFMNEEAYEETKATGKVTFFSRTKNRIWMKGETSGNTLQVVTIAADCDNDTLALILDSAKRMWKTSCSLNICRTSSNSAARKCRKVPTPLPCFKKASTVWHRR